MIAFKNLAFVLLLVILPKASVKAQYREELGEHELRYIRQGANIYKSNHVKVRRLIAKRNKLLEVKLLARLNNHTLVNFAK